MQVAGSEIEMKTFTSPGLAKSGFEKSGPGLYRYGQKKNNNNKFVNSVLFVWVYEVSNLLVETKTYFTSNED